MGRDNISSKLSFWTSTFRIEKIKKFKQNLWIERTYYLFIGRKLIINNLFKTKKTRIKIIEVAIRFILNKISTVYASMQWWKTTFSSRMFFSQTSYLFHVVHVKKAMWHQSIEIHHLCGMLRAALSIKLSECHEIWEACLGRLNRKTKKSRNNLDT